MKKLLLIIVLSFLGNTALAGEEFMNQLEMESIVKAMTQNANGEKGFVSFTYGKVKMHMISDVKHNRMRIIAPVAQYAEITDEQKKAMFVSNFHSSLDARYAVSDGIVYSAYIHPLKELHEEQLKSAVRQVSALALSFGQTYSSGELKFGGE